MKNKIFVILSLFVAVSCSEKIDIETRSMDIDYLAVESIITDAPVPQIVKLSRSTDYFGDDSVPVPASDAKVVISEGSDDYVFIESVPGTYVSPIGFRGEAGKTYSLHIELRDEDGMLKEYFAESTMPRAGFVLDSIDYKYMAPQMDSVWTFGIWGSDLPGEDRYFTLLGTNGSVYPYDQGLFISDTYFEGKSVDGFPFGVFTRNAETRKKYGECAKPLETGDVITLSLFNITQEFYEFLTAFATNVSAVSIPLLTPPPANLPTNLHGENVFGFFTTCSVVSASRIVDDPYRTSFGQQGTATPQ